MSIFRKTQHKLLKKLTAAATVIGSLIGGFSFSPTVSAEIVKVDGEKIADTSGRFDIYADALINDNKTAINHFKQFNLDAKQIANLYYKTSGGNIEANSLLNFINEKSTINGVVNSIKGGTIGGNVYFIAPKGIVIGSGGVINGGSIGLMTPTQDFYDSLLSSDKIDQSKLTADMIKNIEAADIPLNLNGSISISGKLNAVDGIKVASAAIELKNEAQLVSTAEIDFSALVNVEGVASGLDSSKLKITRSEDADGAINLTAVADAAQIENFENISSDKFKEKITSIKSVDDVKTVFSDLTDVNAESSIKVGEKSKINGDGAVNIIATAKGDRHTDDDDTTVNESLPFLNLNSKVEVNGEVTGETVEINAKTSDTFKETVQVETKSEEEQQQQDSNVESKLGEVMSKYLKLSGAYVVHNDEATVTVGQNAKISANGAGDDDNSALKIGAESNPEIELIAKGETEDTNQLIAATAAFINNSANVEINGAINSEGSAEIKADATSNITQTSTNKATDEDTSKLNFAGNILIGNNKAALNLGEKSEINAGGDVSAVANAKEELTLNAEVSIKETGLGGSSINFVNYDSNADTTVSGKVTKSDKLEISAINEIARTVASNNGTEKISTDTEKDEKETDKKTSTDTAKEDTSDNSEEEDEFGLAALFADTSKVAQDKATEGEEAAPPAGTETEAKDQATSDKQEDAQTKTSALENAANYLTVGASANVVLSEDKAAVTINNTAELIASDSLTIEAKNNLTDQKIGAIGQTSAGSSGENKNALVNAAVNVTKFNSDAALLIKGGTINGGTVELNANNIIADQRKSDIIKTIKKTYNEIDALTKSETWSGYKDDLVAFKDSLAVAAKYLFSSETVNPENLKATEKEVATAGVDKTVKDKLQQKVFTDLIEKGTKITADGLAIYGTVKDAATVLGYTQTLLDPANYANFYADSSTTSTAVKDRSAETADGSSAAKVAIAGAVNVNLSDDATRFVIGKDANIVSSGDLKINSINSRDNIVADGHLKPSGAAAVSIGAIVNVNNLNSTNVLAVTQGASLQGNSVELNVNNNISNLILNSGAGAAADKSSTTGDNTTSANTVAVEGSISYVGGKSDALLSVDDGAKLTSTGDLKINAVNNNDLYNIAGGLAYGHGAGSVGIGLAINNFDVNTLAAIQNNDVNSSADMIDLVKAAANADNLFGSGNSGTFTAGNFTNSAETKGNMIALSVTGAAIEQQDKGSESGRTLENFGSKISSKYQYIGNNKFTNFFKDKKEADKNKDADETDKEKDKQTKIKESADKTVKNSDSNKSEKPKDKDAANLPNNTAGQDMPSITVTGAGSASVNLSTIKTKSIVDGVTINSSKDFNVTAADTTNNVAASGAAALNFQKVGLSKNTTNSSTNVGISGAVAWNKVTDDLKAIVKNSTINASSGKANVSATKGGALVAAGLGFDVTSTSRSNTTTVNVAANLSVNHAEESTYANISNSTINANSLTNSATNSDVQVTGGINLSVAKGGSSANAIGASVGYSDIENESLALINNDSKINLTKDLANTANTNIKQITGVVGASVATGSQKSSNAFNGVLAYSKLNNTADAKVDSSTITAQNLINRAFDGEISNSNVNYLEGAGIDTKGEDFLKNLSDDSSAADSNVGTISTNSTGNLQVVGAFDLTVATGSKGGAGLIAVTIGDIDNDFNSIVNNSKVTGNIDADALSNSLAVNAAGGVAISNSKFGGAGSLSWQTTDNQVKAAVTADSSNTVTGNVDLNANSKAREVSVAGEIAISKGAAVGLAMAYNNLNLTTETELKNIQIDGTNIKTTSKNDGSIYAIGAGVNVSNGTAINGSAAVNYGTNSAKNNIEGVTAANATTLETTATDETYRLAIGGGANIGKTVAAGGAVVYNDIGTSDNNQQTKVTVNNSNFDKLQAATIKAEDNSTLKSIAAQLSGSGKVAATGAVAVTTIYKDVGNSVKNSTLTGKITADSNSTQNIFTTADSLAVSGKVGIGAGVAVTNDHTKTTTAFDGGTINGSEVKVNSANTSDLTNIAVGAAGSGNVSVAGSVSINNLSGNTSTTLNNTNITASKNLAVTASGDETINNYAGALSITGTGAAVGASVSVNDIQNTTNASVTGGTINVTGNDSVSAKDTVADSNIINTSISKDLFQTDNSIANLKTSTSYKGFLIDAVSTNTLKSFQICGGAAGTGASVGGTVNVQNIGGSTTSKLDNAEIKGSSDLNVIAHDYTNSEAMVGQIAVTGTGAAVGAAIDLQTVTRNVNAELNQKSDTSINAGNIKVDADSKQGIASLAISGGVAGTGAAVNNATGVYNLKGTTTAKTSSLNGTSTSLGVNANHLANINSVGAMAAVAGEGAGVGATVVIINETDTTSATVDKSNLTANTSDIAAKNKLNLSDQAYAVSAAGVGAGVGGLVEVGNISNTVSANVTNSTLGKSDSNKIAVTADNTTSINNIAGNGSVAGIGGAVGAGVEINTLDTQVSTNIEKSTLNAKDIAVDTNDTKTIKQTGIGASIAGIGAGVQVGVMITNVGEKIADNYHSSANSGKNDGTEVDSNKSINTANDAVSSNLNMVNSSDSNVKNLGLKVNTDSATAGKGSANGGVTNTIKNSTLNAANTLKVKANGVNNFTQLGVATAGAGIGASAAGNIGLVNFKYNTANDINGSTLTAAKNIDINTITSGKNQLDLATASVTGAGGAIGVGYGDLTTKGNNSVTLKNSTITSTGGNVSINTTDTTQTVLNAKSFAFSGTISGGAVIGEVTSNATNNIDISGGTIKGNTIDINATRGESGKNTVKLNSTAATASAGFNGSALVADLDAKDQVAVNVSNSTKLNGSNTINIKATNNQQTLTDVDASSVGTVSTNFTVVSNKQTGTATIDVAKGVEFAATNNNVTANMNGVQKLNTFALNVGAGAVDINTSKVTDDATARAKVNGGNFSKTNANVNVTSNNTVTQNAKVTGIAGGFFANGTSKLESARNVKNEVALVNSGSNINFGTVNAAANTNSTATLNVISGKGGALDVSPEAAYLDDSAGNTANLSIGGDFTATNINVAATTTENDTRKVDATSASVAGYSGAYFNHNDTTSTSISINDKSDFITPNNLNFSAVNNVNYTDDLIGVGAGAIRGNAADMTDGGTFTASLNLGNNTTYKTDKDFTAKSADVLNIKSANLLKAYDIASATVANSKNNFNFTNNVTSGKTTINADNIYLKAGESGKVNLSTIADHKGGAGTAETHAYNTINRNDTITVGDSSALRATTVNLTSKTADKLELNLQSDVFNYAVIPAKTAANMELTLNQNNAINVGSKANLTADEEMILDGSGTVTEMVKSVRYYSTYDGGGEKTVSTNDGTEKISAMTTNNIINVNGTLEAGTHNKIGIEITGNTYKITDGADWFTGAVTFKNTTTKNPYYTRWKEVTDAMKEYPSDSEQYKALDGERASLVTQMNSEGFLKNNNPIETRTDNSVAVLPKMRVSGADIKLYGNKMQGNGSITAHRGSNINVVRKSGGAIEVGDKNSVTFGNLGGIVSFNDAVAKSDNSLKVTSELNDLTPVINIENRSSRSDTNSADIRINYLIDNPAGNVTIKTNNGSISATGTINAQSVSMTAPNGSFTMINEQALLNFSDPITYFTLGDKDIANYIQKRVSLEAGRGNTTLNFGNATDFGNWLYDTLNLYNQSAILKKYNSNTSKSNWVSAYVKRVNEQMNGGKIIAGGDVFINAKDINVNGLIQSGFTNYVGEVDTAKVKSISGKNLADEDVLGEEKYLVTKNYTKSGSKNINAINGVVENSDGYYDKQIELYYNPTTGNILSNDIYSNAGSVTLKGNILSTGGGKIVVSNGAANITVKNDSNKNLKLGNIVSTEGKGIVKIIDKKQNNKETTFSADNKYTPLQNLNYRWTGGGNYKNITDHTITIGLKEIVSVVYMSKWDLLKAAFKGDIKGYLSGYVDRFIDKFYSKRSTSFSNSSYTTYSTGDAIKKNGVYIVNGSSTPYLTISSSSRGVSTSRSKKNVNPFVDIDWDFWNGDIGAKVTWDQTEQGTVTSTYSMKADNPIDIKFIKGNGNVSLSSNGGISDTTVTSNKLDLTNHSANALNVNFNPIGTGTLNVDTQGDAVLNVGGSVNVDIPHASGKNVTVNATGDITGGGDGDFGTLNLNSTKGKIDVKLTYIMRNALNATAAKDINIEQNNTFDSNKYLKLGTIESKTGDVSIKTNGNLVSSVTERQNPTTSTQIENWKNAGILNTWNQTELVNALNANALSKDPYTVDLAPVANIIANKVTLDVEGSIGSTGTAKTITYSNLKKESNLQLLANARAGDLEWGDKSVTYTPHYPIGLTLKDNRSNWNLYLKGNSSDINLAAADNKTAFNVYTSNDNYENVNITLSAAAGIKGAQWIGAKNLTLRGGYGDIVLDYTNYTGEGCLEAITGGNINITTPHYHQGAYYPFNLYIGNIIAGGNVTLSGQSGVRFVSINDNTYISAGKGQEIKIKAYDFGTSKNKAPYILANGANLSLNVQKGEQYNYVFSQGQEYYYYRMTLRGLTGDGLSNKIYIRNIVTPSDYYYYHYYYQFLYEPDNVFEWVR